MALEQQQGKCLGPTGLWSPAQPPSAPTYAAKFWGRALFLGAGGPRGEAEAEGEAQYLDGTQE